MNLASFGYLVIRGRLELFEYRTHNFHVDFWLLLREAECPNE